MHKPAFLIILWTMKIVTVCGLTYSDFVISTLAGIKDADLLVLSFGTVETVDFRSEIKSGDGVFVDLCTLSSDLDCALLCGADTDVYGIKHKSVIVADRGQLIDVSDMVNAPDGYDPGSSYRSYDTSAGKIGVIVDSDIMHPEAAKALASANPDIIVNIADKDADNKQILATRASALFCGLPLLLSMKNYVLLSDACGEVKQSGNSAVNSLLV